MKTFEVMFAKSVNVVGPGTRVTTFAKQTIHTNGDKLDIPVPRGYLVASITEILPDINQEDEKAIDKDN